MRKSDIKKYLNNLSDDEFNLVIEMINFIEEEGDLSENAYYSLENEYESPEAMRLIRNLKIFKRKYLDYSAEYGYYLIFYRLDKVKEVIEEEF